MGRDAHGVPVERDAQPWPTPRRRRRRAGDTGLSIVMFEDLGGRDEDAERAHLDGVARSDIYIGIIGDRCRPIWASAALI
jgi:hypothetical protein